jgi:hypothetical protein
MLMSSRTRFIGIGAALLVIAAAVMVLGPRAAVSSANFEVWLVDQSNSVDTYGGRIHIYQGSSLMGSAAANANPIETIDLGAGTAALCLASTGANPVRPHMVLFNSTHSHAVLSFVASGHVAIFEAETRTPLACLQTSVGAGGVRQAHAAFPSPDGSYILVANQNGKLLERIDTDYSTNSFAFNPAATLDLAGCTTPNGVACQLTGVRPDNAPICPIIDSTSRLGFVTLRGGGMFVVDPTTEPISILAEYDLTTVHGNGCGGIEAGKGIFIDSGGGTAANLSEFDVYRFPLSGYQASNPVNTPAPQVIFSDDATPDRDSHGMVVTRHGRYLWVADRNANLIETFDVRTGAHVGTIPLVSALAADPAPDLGAVSPSGNRVFFSTRGPNPLSGDPHASTGSNPGLLVIQVTNAGRSGEVKALAPISNIDAGGVERADGHGLAVRLK